MSAEKRKIIVGNKEYTMPRMSVDTYMSYLDLTEVIDTHTRYTRTDVEAMIDFLVVAYDNQFTAEELKDSQTGLDAAGIIMEFQCIDMGVANELTKRIENLTKN
ncbi:MAG: hypothetical protein IJ567_05615 [Lachnospiraceae bacterium]|nr:hypothetical protein [Lachnospiraceae bacterium]